MRLPYRTAPDKTRSQPSRNVLFDAAPACARVVTEGPRSRQLRRSKTIAMPWPPPTHMVSRPIVLSWNWRLFSSVVAILAPVMPNGCPTAIAPPFTFSRLMSIPRSR